MYPKKLLSLIATTFIAVSLQLQAQVPTYNVTILPSEGVGFIATTALNNLGEVTGYWILPNATGYSAFLYANGTMTNLPIYIGTDVCIAYGINDDTQIVGTCTLNETNSTAFVYSLDGGALDLGGFGARDINNLGQIVGEFDVNGKYHAALFHSNGTITDLGTLKGPNGFSVAFWINDKYQQDGVGQIVGASSSPVLPGLNGRQGFLYANGVISNIGQIVCPDQFSQAYCINNAGQIVGVCINLNNGDATGFFYDPADERINHLKGDAAAINDQGWIIGTYYDDANFTSVPYLYINGTMYNLFDLIPFNPGIDPDTFLPVAINNQGQIVGIISNYLGSALLTPIE